jgi:hypothetical protein
VPGDTFDDGTLFDDGTGWADQTIRHMTRRRWNLYGSGAAPGLPLDAYASGLVAATSPHRRLLTSYTGPLIQVRRSVPDTTTLDIGYNVSNVLDQTALLAFAGSGEASVTRIYFQNGSGNYLVPIAASTKIVSTGIVQKTGNIPVEKCGASAHFGYISNSVISITGTTMSCYAGRSFGGSATGEVIIALSRASDGWALFGTDSVTPMYRDGTNPAIKGLRNNTNVCAPITVSGFFVAGCRLDGANMNIRAAGTDQAAASTGTLAVTNVLRAALHNSNGSNGPSDNSLIGECVVWSTDIGATALNAIIAAYEAYLLT